MEIDRKTAAELGLSGGVLLLFVGAVYVASQTFAAPADAANNSTSPAIEPQGGLVIVGIIAAFVLLMGGVGVWMYRMDFE